MAHFTAILERRNGKLKHFNSIQGEDPFIREMVSRKTKCYSIRLYTIVIYLILRGSSCS